MDRPIFASETTKTGSPAGEKSKEKNKIITNKKDTIMKTIEATPMAIAQYEKDAFVAKCKKSISKFISTYLVFFQMPTGMFVSPDQQQIWR